MVHTLDRYTTQAAYIMIFYAWLCYEVCNLQLVFTSSSAAAPPDGHYQIKTLRYQQLVDKKLGLSIVG
jgi:hypothetical protein